MYHSPNKDYDYSPVRVKICGITRLDDALFAAKLGVNALGFVFSPNSPRFINSEQARIITEKIPPFITRVGLFVNQDKNEVLNILHNVSLDLLQFHGDEDADYCEQFSRTYIKAIRMQSGLNIEQIIEQHPKAQGFLVDSYQAGVAGGTGHAFDWDIIPPAYRNSIMLAGGLSVENVERAIRTIRPYAVDVSSGVEASKGIKDHTKMKLFMRGVLNASPTV